MIKSIRFLFILGFTILIVACGSFEVEPVVDTAPDPDIEATVAASVAATRAAEETEPAGSQSEPAVIPVEPTEIELEMEPETDDFSEETADLPDEKNEKADRFMPAVASFDDESAAEWGAAFCPESILPICVRPYAVESLGTDQVLLLEVWGTGNQFSAAANNLSLTFQATTTDDKTRSGSNCGNTLSKASHYEAGFGYLVRHCFSVEEPISQIVMRFNGAGSSFEVSWEVGDQLEPVGGYNFLTNAGPVVLDQSFNIGPAAITIHDVEDLGSAIKVDLTIEAINERLLVNSPDWIVIGPSILFATADENGVQGRWDEGKMSAYETVGGEIKAEESQTGTVILTKAAANSGLVISYGLKNAGPLDSVIFDLNP